MLTERNVRLSNLLLVLVTILGKRTYEVDKIINENNTF